MRIKLCLFWMLSSTLAFSVFVQAAPIVPDAGQASQELQQQPELIPPSSPEPLPAESATTPETETRAQAKIAVTAIRVTGSSAFPAGELEALVADLSGQQLSIAELEAGAGRITAHYRSQGYLVARAYLPAQDIKDGVVIIAVLEGLLGERRVSNQSRISDERANVYLSELKHGEALQAKSANRALLLLRDTPGVGEARASLQPGASVGTSDLVVELTPAPPYAANIELDNHGNRYTGEHRAGATLRLDSPFGQGEQLSLRALVTDQHLTYARIAAQMPVGNNGLRLGAAYSSTRYRLGKEFAPLQAYGSANNASLYATYPFIRGQSGNLFGLAGWESKQLADGTDAPVTHSDKRVRMASIGLAGNRPDGIGGGGITSFDLTVASGSLDMDAVSQAADESSARSNGAFTRLALNLNRRQRLTASDALSFALEAQQADKNLATSEKFYLGGANSVRAYPQGEASGDEGYLVNLELRHNYAKALQALLFYDAGYVTINRNPYLSGSANSRYLAGIGAGVNATLAGMQLKASLAWRTSGGDPTSDPSKRNPRLWLQAGKQF